MTYVQEFQCDECGERCGAFINTKGMPLPIAGWIEIASRNNYPGKTLHFCTPDCVIVHFGAQLQPKGLTAEPEALPSNR